ncbi:MAG: putative UDP-sugar epimerase [Herbinix sp.]|nr:putative UDP-sugar epimerase [Herbinix sp.]
MKKILITGANSYIGTSFEKWLELQYPDQYAIDTIDMKDGTWKSKDFTEYDTVFHVAGIAHVSLDPKLENLYYKVNCNLAIETAEHAKNAGVKQFVFMSSIMVYGDNRSESKVIDHNTVPVPNNFYGDSKLKAEEGIKPLESSEFKVVILRAPMIYGKGSKGNYSKLAKAAQKLPLFPDIENQRSMLHIDNLCEFIRLIVDNEESGLYFPQNSEYVKTSELVKLAADAHGKKIILTKVFNGIVKLMIGKIGIFDKVFGNLVYEKSMSCYVVNYQVRDLIESIKLTEGT